MTTQSAFGALAGLRVIDLTRVLGGPYCTQILGDHGAEIIKLEPPAGDETRQWAPLTKEGSAYYNGANRNKRSIGLDLTKPRGRDVLMTLLKDADVLIENFKPGTLDKWGIGNAFLREKFPKLIHCRISGFGGDGPRGGQPGYDAIVQAMAGMIAANGSPEGGPTRIGIPVVDLTTGLYAAVGILMALNERQKSGLGQFLETTLFETGLAVMHPHSSNYFFTGKTPVPQGNPHPSLAPYESFETRDGLIFIGIGNDGTFRKLCQEVGKPELATDTRFARNQDRITNREQLRSRDGRGVQAPRPRRAVRPSARRGLAGRADPVHRQGAEQRAQQASRHRHSEGLVQGRRLADPLRPLQGEPASRPSRLQRACQGDPGRSRTDAGRGRCPRRRRHRQRRRGHGQGGLSAAPRVMSWSRLDACDPPAADHQMASGTVKHGFA